MLPKLSNAGDGHQLLEITGSLTTQNFKRFFSLIKLKNITEALARVTSSNQHLGDVSSNLTVGVKSYIV